MMAKKHEIVKALESLVHLQKIAENHLNPRYVANTVIGNRALSYLVNLFLCPKCQGDGVAVVNGEKITIDDILKNCSDCGGTGIKPGILNKIEATAISKTCRVCGCTDEQGCRGGCYWVDYDLCSNCV